MTALPSLPSIGMFLLVSWAFFALRLAWFVSLAPGAERVQVLVSHLLGLLVWAVLWLFLGYVLWVVAVGSVFPSLLEVATPLVCPDGQFRILTQAYSYKPGQHGTSVRIVCLLADGEPRPILALTIFWAGLIWSAVFLTLWLWLGKLGLRLIRLGPRREPGESARDHEQRSRAWLAARTEAAKARSSGGGVRGAAGRDPAQRLRTLKALCDEGLIDEAAYVARRNDILKEL